MFASADIRALDALQPPRLVGPEASHVRAVRLSGVVHDTRLAGSAWRGSWLVGARVSTLGWPSAPRPQRAKGRGMGKVEVGERGDGPVVEHGLRSRYPPARSPWVRKRGDRPNFHQPEHRGVSPPARLPKAGRHLTHQTRGGLAPAVGRGLRMVRRHPLGRGRRADRRHRLDRADPRPGPLAPGPRRHRRKSRPILRVWSGSARTSPSGASSALAAPPCPAGEEVQLPRPAMLADRQPPSSRRSGHALLPAPPGLPRHPSDP